MTSYFPHLTVGCKLNEAELSLLKERLYKETEKLKFKFASLMFNLQKDLENRLQTEDVVNFLVFYDNKFEPLLSHCTRIAQVFIKVRNFVSFFDYDLLEQLIGELGSSTIKQKLKEYTESFEVFSKRRVCECPNDTFGKVEESEKVCIIKTDQNIEILTVEEMKKLKYQLNQILDSKVFILLRVEEGCLQLVFRCFNQDEYTVTMEQVQALQKLGVISLTYGHQCIIINDESEISPLYAPKVEGSPVMPISSSLEHLVQGK